MTDLPTFIPTCTEQVADEIVSAVVGEADDGKGGEERESILRNPLPAEYHGKNNPEESSMRRVRAGPENNINSYLFFRFRVPPKCKDCKRVTTEM
jgi:hypothetical protein